MATGMVNTSAMQQNKPASQPAAQAPVLRSGEKTAMEIAGSDKSKIKTYYHQLPGARFIMPDGLELTFMGGMFATDRPEIIAELDKVVDRPASMICSHAPGALAEMVAKDATAADQVQL